MAVVNFHAGREMRMVLGVVGAVFTIVAFVLGLPPDVGLSLLTVILLTLWGYPLVHTDWHRISNYDEIQARAEMLQAALKREHQISVVARAVLQRHVDLNKADALTVRDILHGSTTLTVRLAPEEEVEVGTLLALIDPRDGTCVAVLETVDALEGTSCICDVVIAFDEAWMLAMEDKAAAREGHNSQLVALSIPAHLGEQIPT